MKLPLLKNKMHQQVLILAASQAIFQSASMLVMTIGALAGSQIASSASYATLPVASMFLGNALATIPASMFMAKFGRKTGFMLGAFIGLIGGLIAGLGIFEVSLSLLCFGTFCVGVYQGFAQFYRFAASEVADKSFQPKAIGFVLAGGIIAAFIGPNLGKLGKTLLYPDFMASFLILSIICLVGLGALMFLKIPKHVETQNDHAGETRTLKQIIMQPRFFVALFSAATGSGIMVLAMTATPLAMTHSGHNLSMTTMVIQLHVIAMFLPSFFTGSLISKFGALPIMFTGILLFSGHVFFTLSGTSFYPFAVALILLGVGWNFLYVGGTSLLTGAYRPSEKNKAQGTNDFVIVLVSFICSMNAGVLYDIIGWRMLNIMLLPWLTISAMVILIYAYKKNKIKVVSKDV